MGRTPVGRLPRRRHRRHGARAAVGERHDPGQRFGDHYTLNELSDYGLQQYILVHAGRSDAHRGDRPAVPL